MGSINRLFFGGKIFLPIMHNFEETMVQLKLRSSYWIVDEDGNIIIGKGRAEILKNIEKTGSISHELHRLMKPVVHVFP